MKKATIKDYWSIVKGISSYPNSIMSIEQHFNNDEIHIFCPDGLMAVVGSNGAGKTSFFDFLTDTGYSRVKFPKHQLLLGNCDILDIPESSVTATIIDPLKEITISNKALLDVKSTFGQEELNRLKEEEENTLNYVLDSQYDKISIEEVQTTELGIKPRFLLEKNGVEFDNETLSYGEQSVLFIFWFLVKKYKSPGIFFIEEPESGLSPQTQSRLIEMFAQISSSKKKQLILSTHSPFIVEALGENRVIVIKKDSSSSWSAANSSNYIEELGLLLPKKDMFFLEDNKAKVFLEKLLDIYGSSIRRNSHLVFLNGESDVYQVVKRIPRAGIAFNITGMLDADQKGDAKYNTSDKFVFLPGQFPPEKEVISYLDGNLVSLSKALTVNIKTLKDAIIKCKALNHHDFFEELSKKLFGEVKPSVYENAFKVWFENYPDRDEIRNLIFKIDPDVTVDEMNEVDEMYPVLKAQQA